MVMTAVVDPARIIAGVATQRTTCENDHAVADMAPL